MSYLGRPDGNFGVEPTAVGVSAVEGLDGAHTVTPADIKGVDGVVLAADVSGRLGGIQYQGRVTLQTGTSGVRNGMLALGDPRVAVVTHPQVPNFDDPVQVRARNDVLIDPSVTSSILFCLIFTKSYINFLGTPFRVSCC